MKKNSSLFRRTAPPAIFQNVKQQRRSLYYVIRLLAHSKRVVEFKSIYKKCLNHGLNVITIGSFASYPWHNFPELTHQLDELAKANGVTITGTGNQDFFMVNLPVLMSGVCHRLDRITHRSLSDVNKCQTGLGDT